MLKEFKKFILRGNVVDLAVAVVIGAAFTQVVNAVVSDFLTPLIGAIQGKQDFAKYAVDLSPTLKLTYGHFLNVLISFLLTAAVVFFLVVQPLNHLNELSKRAKKPEDPTERKCPECLSDIPVAATRCKFCTAKVTPTKPQKS